MRQDDINIIVSGRRSGKTTALIEECAKINGLMVARNREHASWIYETAKKSGLPNTADRNALRSILLNFVTKYEKHSAWTISVAEYVGIGLRKTVVSTGNAIK